jgi:hypothetical protein
LPHLFAPRVKSIFRNLFFKKKILPKKRPLFAENGRKMSRPGQNQSPAKRQPVFLLFNDCALFLSGLVF